MKKIIMNSVIAFAAVTLTACGGSSSSSSSQPETTKRTGEVHVRNMEFSYEGSEEYNYTNTIVCYFISDDGGLGVRVNGISDSDGNISKAKVENLQITSGDSDISERSAIMLRSTSSELICREVGSGEAGSGDMFDIVISLDTTASMGHQAELFAEKIVDFAGALGDEGLDVMFAGITVGDAFATKSSGDSSDYESSTVRGSLGQPPAFDLIERPDTGSELLNVEDIQEFFEEVKEVVGSGLGGGDGPENFLAPLDYMNKNVNFREKAGRLMIAIGDNCTHSNESLQGIWDYGSENPEHAKWLPRDAEDTQEEFVKQGVAVNLIWQNNMLDCGAPFIDMSPIQKSTGGSFSPLARDTDLTTLPMIEAVGSKRKTIACEIPKEGSVFTVTFDVVLDSEAEVDAKWTVGSVVEL